MPSLKLTRTSYSDPSTPTNPRTSDVKDREALFDFERHHRPVEQVHASSLHGRGVASGLTVTATTHAPGLQIATGVAVDAEGRHISLADGGIAKVDDPTTVGGTIFLTVTSGGVALPTAGLGGPMYLTIAFDEAFDDGALIGSGHTIFQINHTPYLQLAPATGFVSDGSQVILATVTLGSGADLGKVTALTGEGRRRGAFPTSDIRFNAARASTTGSALSVDDATVGEIGPRASGGLLVTTNALAAQAPGGSESFVIDGATGNANFVGTLAAASLAIGHTADVGGDLSIGGRASAASLNVSSGAFVRGDLSIAGIAYVGHLQSDHDAVIAGNLYAGGRASAGTLQIVHDAVIGGNLSARGSATFDSLTVANQASLGGGGTCVIGPGSISASSISAGSLFGSNLSGQSLRCGTVMTDGILGHDLTGSNSLGIKATHVQIDSDVTISGHLHKPAGSFKIDHPGDPAHKYLSHSFVESPDMMNVYNGNVTTDRQGHALVVLPEYFETLNGDFRYQLTPIGQAAMAHVSREIDAGRFSIQTDRPQVKISWQVTGIRRDPYALAHPIRVEEEKPEAERGSYLHPQLYGQAAERSFFRIRRPDIETPESRPDSPHSSRTAPDDHRV